MTRETVENSWALDMRDVVQLGYLEEDGPSTIWCKVQGRFDIEIGWKLAGDNITLDYYHWAPGKIRSTYRRNVVRIIRTPSVVGKERTWFECPDCRRTVRKLYLPPSGYYFLCRTCHGLSYQSRHTRLSHWERLRRLEEDLEALPLGSVRQLKKLEKMEAQFGRLRRHLDFEYYRLQLGVFKLSQPKRHPGRPRKADPAKPSRPEPEVVKKERVKLPPGRPKTKRPYHRDEPFIRGEKKSESERLCMRCRDWREIEDAKLVTLANGRSALKGHCPVCGAKMTAIVKAT